MMRSLWVAKTGMDAMQMNIDVISHNLANVNTNGFKRSRPVFEDLLYQTIRQPGGATSQQTQLPTGLQLGTGVKPVATERIHTQGNLQLTESPFDVAINGSGFFQIEMPDGTIGYTRDGAFQLNNQGVLVTAEGYPVSGNITVPQNTLRFGVSRDGVVTALQAGQTQATQIGNIQLATFINTAGLQSVGENLYLETSASGAPQVSDPGQNGAGVLNQQYVETSNVNITEELINMIQAQRAFEINSRSIQTSDQMLQKLTQL
ncbi:flagellar basal-body rod protein FlgG [Chitinimonas sp. BJB300]|uniref:flagellar basal-body rod protein FlgG n=1 Tax=Chitinimonas sp. BJB300 TaxID=1559339 RepID=UPI000C10D03B|nr:flagellar basal-body rod protein FlgG [Chitinimonas sp. BJB300]PHV11237.1 flagellar basal-body rod protein FlgG [Chitinimonas sp. BJB300]TSJ88617.1 flagellar basal-body rod protein FlgG [Chitinimonas sp. BJB300]